MKDTARPDPIKGQTVYALERSSRPRDGEPRPLVSVVVTKVGRKYFTVHPENDREGRGRGTEFHLGTWRERTKLSEDTRLYADPREREDELEVSSIQGRLRKTFDGYNKCEVPLETLRKIIALIDAR